MNEIVQVIMNVGFPIAACIAMGWYVKYITDKHAKEVAELHKMYSEQLDKMEVALNNNTLALQKLCERIEK